MYCVKCGKKATGSEKRCEYCGMRLVTPARLNRLLKSEKQLRLLKTQSRVKQTLAVWWKRFVEILKRILAWLQVHLEQAGEKIDAMRRAAAPRIKLWAGNTGKKLKKWYRRFKKKLRIWWNQIKQERKEAQASTPRASRSSAGSNRNAAAARRTVRSAEQNRREREILWQSGGYSDSYDDEYLRPTVRRRTDGAPQSAGKTGAFGRTSSVQTSRRPAAQRTRTVGNVRSAGTSRQKQRKPAKPSVRRFAEQHLRTIVALGALLVSLLAFICWGNFSDGGMRFFARLGMGKAQGYILLGDDCMAAYNYSRAAENYREALAKDNTYAAALKLAIAYSYTGDISTEAGVLLWCTQYYPEQKQPYQQLLVLYNNYEVAHTEKVRRAIEQGILRFGSLG